MARRSRRGPVAALLAIVAIGYGASTIGGERERGLLELVLAYPVTRRRVAVEKAVGLLATVALLATGVLVIQQRRPAMN